MDAQREMPKYQCHKQVHALKIAAIEFADDGTVTITPADDGFAPFVRGAEWRERFKGDNGDLGYYVVYSDGYASWSPTKAFEEGYTKLE